MANMRQIDDNLVFVQLPASRLKLVEDSYDQTETFPRQKKRSKQP